ncbi:MAG: tetratricopeptide repeat protein [Promethearchaeota archaeon]|nr:MAG: tetratricopeptide repeat protein [Candidatus Lokiarchaeota archaeon]
MSSTNSNKLEIRDGKRYYGDAWMEKRAGNYILHLKGSPYEIGYQHGILMKEEIKQGAAGFYADPINGGRKSYSLKNWLIKLYLNKKVYNPIKKAQPKELLEQLKGIADGSGVSYKTIFKANHHTAVTMVMTPVIIKQHLKKFNQFGINVGACSTFVATKEATFNGSTIVGRNTDYGGIDYWPKYQTISFVEPEKGFKYVQIGTAGIIMWAPGMNEKGIVVCAHYMIYDDILPNGLSIAAFTDEFLRKAENLEDALAILNKNPRGASCGFVITDGKSKDAFAAEVSTEKATIRRIENNRIIMTNMAVSEEKRKIDFVSQFHLNEGCPGRYRRIMQLIDENYGKIDYQKAAEFMGDHIRFTTGTERCAYGIVGVDDNVNSMVFSPEELKLWVATGPAPVCNNPYIGFDFEQEMSGTPSKITPDVLEGYHYENPKKKVGMQKFNQAYIIHERNPTQKEDMIKLIAEAIEEDPEEVIYYQMAAKLLLHQGKYNEAINYVENALNLKQSLNETAHNYLVLGILYDLKGDREKSISYYQKIDSLLKEEPQDPWFKVNAVVGSFAQLYIKQPFSKKNLKDRSVLIDFSQGVGVE